MKKQVLIAAVGAALAAGPMVASAGASVFGHFHVSVDYYDGGALAATTTGVPESNTYISDNSSRVGVKGDEALGGGMKAIYQFELPFTADANANLANTRSSWVGLSTMAGDLKLGKHDSPYKSIGRAIDPFNEMVGDQRNVTTVGNGVEGSFVNNAIVYETPTFAGVKVSALYGTGEGSDTSSITGVGATWNWGGLFVGGAYGMNRATNAATEEEGIRLVARYTFGFGLGIYGLYEMRSDVGGTATGGTARDIDSMGIGASFKFGNNTIAAQYFLSDDTDVAAGSRDGSLMAAMYQYNFSKTTRAYVAYAQSDNDAQTNAYLASGAGHGAKFSTSGTSNGMIATTPNGEKTSAASVGMVVDF